MSYLTKTLVVLIAIALAALAGINSYLAFHFAQVPLAVSEVAVTNSPVQRGQNVLIHYTSDRRVLCKTDGDISIFELPDMLLVLSERRSAGINPLGISSGLVPMPTKDLKPGNYLLRMFIYNDCGDRLHTIELPDMRFEIVG